ncbi:MAG: hypothetical protein V8K32_10850 [Candidatus Electrothrix gigas]
MKRPGGDILAFLPTERDILDTVDLLRKELADRAWSCPCSDGSRAGNSGASSVLPISARSSWPPMWQRPPSRCRA